MTNNINLNLTNKNLINQTSLNPNDTYKCFFSDRIDINNQKINLTMKDSNNLINNELRLSKTNTTKRTLFKEKEIPTKIFNNNIKAERNFSMEPSPQTGFSNFASNDFKEKKIENTCNINNINTNNTNETSFPNIITGESFTDRNHYEVSGKIYNQMFGDLNKKISFLTNENNSLKVMLLNNTMNNNNTNTNNQFSFSQRNTQTKSRLNNLNKIQDNSPLSSIATNSQNNFNKQQLKKDANKASISLTKYCSSKMATKSKQRGKNTVEKLPPHNICQKKYSEHKQNLSKG
jgi:hypothetical protein